MAAVDTLWTAEQTEDCRSGLSVIPAMGYVGDLVGAVVCAHVLYPDIGLIPTIFVLTLPDEVTAPVFVAHFDAWS